MGTALIISLIVVGVLNLGLGLVVMLASERKTLRQIIFFIFSLSVATWAFGVALFLATSSPEVALLWARIYYLAAAIIGYTLLAFALTFVPNTNVRFWVWFLLLPLVVMAGTILTSNSLLSDVRINHVEGNEVLLGAQAYAAYSLYFLAYMYGAIIVAARQYWLQKNKEMRHQLFYIIAGLTSAGTFGVFFNLILPWLGNYHLVWVGPQFSIVLVGFIFAAIVRHRLFDVRVVIARATAYIALLVSMALLYGVAVFSVSSLLFDGRQMSVQQNILYIVLAVVLAFTFQPLKRFFDRITNRIFYRDTYDSQLVLDQIGAVLANTVSLTQLTSEVLEILRTSIKPSSLQLVLANKPEVRMFGKGGQKLDVQKTLSHLSTSVGGIVIKEDIFDHNSELYQLLDRAEVAVVVRLKTSKDTVGYLVFGDKAGGNIYSAQDINLINVTADELAVGLQNAERFEEIHEFNNTLQQKVDEATKELRESNKQLKALDVVKDEFISMASHQLRTPLTSIKGYISMLLDGDAGKVTPEQHRFLEEAFISSQRMVYLVGDFLNVSRIQTGKFVLEQRPTNLAALVQDEIDRLKLTAEHRDVTLTFIQPKDMPMINLDEEKMRQVIMNFIDNAIFYSKASGVVEIKLTVHEDHVRLEVTDQGIGVPQSEQHQLFGKFFRATNARRSRPDGTGIGLFLAKKVVTVQGGHVFYETKENIGSTFGFVMPLKTKAMVASEKPVAASTSS